MKWVVLWVLFTNPWGTHQGTVSEGWVNWYVYETMAECREFAFSEMAANRGSSVQCVLYTDRPVGQVAVIME